MIKRSIFIDLFILIKFYTEGYRSGHNEAVLKVFRSNRLMLRKNRGTTRVPDVFSCTMRETFLAVFSHF